MHRADDCFHLPKFPKPEYYALKTTCQRLGCTQSEAFCVLLRIGAEYINTGQLDRLVTELAEFRATAPKEQPPLIKE